MGYQRVRFGRMSMRERMQRNALSCLVQSDPERRQQLLADPSVHESVKAGLRRQMAWEQEAIRPLPPKRHKIRRPVDGKPVERLEKHVLADVLQALRQDPRVALVERTQSGLFQDGERYIRVGTPGKLDITIMLMGGRYGEIEVKRPGGKPDERQQRRIDDIKKNGGISGCATSAEEALALLP